ncbi:hypothetical protein RRG08_004214 [Elysia crispata]|uniref:Uncharacterized protein n=1 Tax=Elysia crispata TaxID=231223 RepID=A0AAE1DIB8_9GAST|nr:hypothetical protein RRG08_004214 [Elysia crispata]
MLQGKTAPPRLPRSRVKHSGSPQSLGLDRDSTKQAPSLVVRKTENRTRSGAVLRQTGWLQYKGSPLTAQLCINKPLVTVGDRLELFALTDSLFCLPSFGMRYTAGHNRD